MNSLNKDKVIAFAIEVLDFQLGRKFKLRSQTMGSFTLIDNNKKIARFNFKHCLISYICYQETGKITLDITTAISEINKVNRLLAQDIHNNRFHTFLNIKNIYKKHLT